MDIAVGTRGMRGRSRARNLAVAVQAALIVLAVALLIALASSSRPYVGDPGTGTQGPPSTVQVAPHPVPAPLGS
jgi:hypothetical protein